MKNINKYWDSNKDDFSNRPSIIFQDEIMHHLTGNVLDLGCGNGALVKKLNENGVNAYGITYNQEEVDKKIHNNVYFGDMQDIPFVDEKFDTFVMWDSLEHCQSAYIALCEAKRILKYWGKGIIFMPGQNWLNCHCHITCYTVPQMEQLFRQAGLRCKEIHEKVYRDDPKKACEGMAIYIVTKDPNYKAVFAK